jgi:tetratricopeptide (TPR) repeat protein
VNPGRNDPCPCGSSKKYKKCCGQPRSAAPVTPLALGPKSLSQLASLMSSGRYAQAEKTARALLERRPDLGLVWKIYGAALVVQNKDALQALQRASQVLPNDAETHYYLGNVLHDRGQFSAAVARQRRAVELKPDFAEAYDSLGSALRDLGQLNEAVASHRRAIEIKPGLAEAHNNLGNALVGLRRFDEALPSYQRALDLRPDFAEAIGNLANAQRAAGRVAEAIAGYRRVLEIKPQLAEAHNNLGNALLELGQLEEALASYRRALELRPNFAQALGNLANALRDAGRVAEAIAGYRRLLAMQPQSAEAYHSLGIALLRLGQFDEAVGSFRRALELRPDYAQAHSNLGNALRNLGQLNEALASHRRALEIKPDLTEAHYNEGNALLDLVELGQAEASYRRALALRADYAEAHLALGMVLRQRGRAAEAEASARRALEIKPDGAAIMTFLADILTDKGRFTDAEQLFGQALSIDPDLPEAWAGTARCRRMGPGDTAWLAAAQRVLTKRLPVQHEIKLRFAAGKYFDDLNDYDQAFSQYRTANELTRRYGIRYDRQRATQRVDRIMASYDRPWFDRSRTEAKGSERAVFVVGMPRAGTSLVEQILASHSAVFGAGELTFWNAASGAEQSAGMTGELAAEYLRQIESLATGARRVIDKMPTNFMNLGLIHAALPNARVIHVRRDPIDTCLSIFFQNFSTTHPYANDLEDLTHHYGQYLRLMEHWRATLPAGIMLEVPYEQLVDDLEAWSRTMLEFIGLPWEPRCLEFHATDRIVATTSNWQVRQKISRASVGRWHNYEKFIGPLRPLLER